MDRVSGNVVALPESDEQRRTRLGISEPVELLYNHGVEQKNAGRFTAAAVAMRRAIGLAPDCAMLWNGLGAVLCDLGDHAGAASALDRARGLGEDSAIFHSNLGLLAGAQLRFDEAEGHFGQSLKRDPDNLHTAWNIAITRLESGDWDRGLDDYEVRRRYLGSKRYPAMPFPIWEGQNLNGKTIYVQGEQGAGDRILCSRYLRWLKSEFPATWIKFSCGDELLALFLALSDNGICELVPDNTPWPDADYGCFLMSLPRLHGTTPQTIYPDPDLLRPHAAKLKFAAPPPRLPALKVGIAWTGNPAQGRNHERSIPFPLLLELEDNPSVQLYSLQFGAGQADIKANGAEQLVTDLVPLIGPRGYLGTAAAMLGLDLVVTACTSVAHLAGALCVPCWVLLCHDPYWIWLREGDKTPWYSSLRLLRQEHPGEWGPVIDRVKIDLADTAAAHLHQPAAVAARL